MSKFGLIILLFLFTNVSFAQVGFSKISFLTGGTWNSPVLKKIGNPTINESFKPKLGIRIAGLVSIDLNNSLSVSTGLQFAEVNYQTELKNLLFIGDIIDGTITNVHSEIQVLNFGFPLYLDYYFNSTKRNISVSIGGNFYRSIIGKNKKNITGSGSGSPAVRQENDLAKFNASIFIGFSYLVALNKNVTLFFTPSSEFFLIPEEQYFTKTKTNTLSLGLTIGLSYYIRNNS